MITVRELQDFKQGALWKLLEERMLEFLTDIHIAFENTDNELKDFYTLSGNALAVRRMLSLPDVLIHELELLNEEKEEKDGR